MKEINIVLVEPEIPQNTGNISRTCVCTGAKLHLVKPMGFSVDEKNVRRAGLDYWKDLDLQIHESLADFLEFAKGKPMVFASTKAAKNHTEAEYPDGVFILFGKETKGLPEELLRDNYEKCVRIPMIPDQRSLNLSNSVAVVLYEALRQSGFDGLSDEGHLTKFRGTENEENNDI